MSDILFAQPIFSPNEALFNKNIASIESLGNYLRAFPSNMVVAFAGYVKTDEYWHKISSTIKRYFGPTCIFLDRLDKNSGKALTVNAIVEESLKKRTFDYILTADSDIVFDIKCPMIMPRLLGIANRLEEIKKKPIGVIALNQKEANVHSQAVYQNQIKFDNTTGHAETIVSPDIPGGIAGGCWITTTKCWTTIKGYRVMGVYASDDACYLTDAANHGFSWQVAESIYIIHPHENDEIYARWKMHQAVTTSLTIKPSLDKYIQRAEEFWKNR